MAQKKKIDGRREFITEALSKLVKERYPKVIAHLAAEIKCLLESPQGFGNTTVTSPAKTVMMEKLQEIRKCLLEVERQEKVA